MSSVAGSVEFDSGYGTGVSGAVAVDKTTIADGTVKLTGKSGKVLGANAHAQVSSSVIQSGEINSLETSLEVAAA